ncbi:hypothetical protein [Caballeronia grimmiae]|uniref:hypothetical protein n=1 Tax=Caballeronia grimmiae TaxID=1071679 RepID=UPI0038BB3FE3
MKHPVAPTDEVSVAAEPVLVADLLYDTIEDTDASHDQTGWDCAHRYGSQRRQVFLEGASSSGNIDVVAHISDEAKLVKRTAPIYNLRDIVEAPFADWRAQTTPDDFDPVQSAVNQPGGVDPAWKALFDAVHAEVRAVA